MAGEIGILVPLKYDWLEKTAELLLDGYAPIEIKEKLREYLAFDLQSPTNIRKSCTELMRTWVQVREEALPLRDYALSVYSREASTHALLHWCMLLLNYPVFSDISGIIGDVLTMQPTFSSAWLNDKIKAQWGDRNSFEKSTGVILKIMCELGALESCGKGIYTPVTREVHSTSDLQVLVRTLLAGQMKPWYEVHDFARVPQLFPFAFEIDYEWVHSQPNLTLNSIGGRVTVTLKEA